MIFIDTEYITFGSPCASLRYGVNITLGAQTMFLTLRWGLYFVCKDFGSVKIVVYENGWKSKEK